MTHHSQTAEQEGSCTAGVELGYYYYYYVFLFIYKWHSCLSESNAKSSVEFVTVKCKFALDGVVGPEVLRAGVADRGEMERQQIKQTK